MPSDFELNSTDRLKNLVKLTDVIEVDALKNLQEMLRRELIDDRRFQLSKTLEIYDTDIANVAKFPCLCLEVRGSTTDRRTIGKDAATFLRTVFIDVWYYISDVNEHARSLDLITAMGRIITIINRNADLNGYCRMGVRQEGGATVVEKLFGEKVIRGARISLRIPILYRDRAAGPG